MWDAMYANRAPIPAYPDPASSRGTYELTQLFKRYLPDGKGRRLLEMGCGGSKWLPWFARGMEFEVSGVDYSEGGCVRARASLEAAGVRGDIHCADFNKLEPSFGESFDVVTSFGVVEHFEDPAPILRTFAGCLKPGGLLLTFVPNMAGLVGSLIKRLDRSLYDTHRVFDLEQFRSFHEAAGLEVRFAAYTGWGDLQAAPVDRLGNVVGLVYKNLAYGMNRVLLPPYRAFQNFRPQSPWLCDSMITVARRKESPAAQTQAWSGS